MSAHRDQARRDLKRLAGSREPLAREAERLVKRYLELAAAAGSDKRKADQALEQAATVAARARKALGL